uniref:NAD(P)(+)--arginine ADP-ribosyltransferase 1 precursor n=1 Tax=Gallus gallus TaxID=9031 RepID=UPI0018D1B573|nr:NAD(P)(+)--arginine ADP-ribosyltransferase 1 precursor [Gallus gallus]
MELLALRWVLLAGTLLSTSAASSALQEGDLGSITVIMDMALNSFDDQYEGWAVMGLITEVNVQSLPENAYAVSWRKAAAEWQKRWEPRSPMQLRQEQAIAVLAYSAASRMCTLFNEATRQGGRSHQDYVHSYHFKTLHFLLTQALFALRASQPRCYYVYRGVRGIRFHDPKREVCALRPVHLHLPKEGGHSEVWPGHPLCGEDLLWCPHQAVLLLPSEDEVLIPPFEVFEVINFSNDRGSVKIQLHSKGKMSRHNCELLKPQGGQWGRGHQEVGLGLSPGLALPVLPCSNCSCWGSGHRAGDPIPAAV